MDTKKMTLVIMPLCGTDHPHIGVGYITAYLEKYGYTVIQSDFNLILRDKLNSANREIFSNYSRKWSKYEEYNSYIYPIIEPYMNEYAENLARNDSGVIGFSTFFSNIYPVLMLAQKIKNINPEKIIIIGGPEANEKYIKYDCIDFIAPGEGEITLLELMDAVNGAGNFKYIKGLIYRDGNKVVNTGERPFIENLDMLPFPVFQDFAENNYNYECIPIAASRGCINKCSFCTESRYWKCFRSRSGESVFNELIEQRKRYGVYQSNGELREFAFMDSLVNANIKELTKFCNLMIDYKINSPWVGKVAVSKNLTKEVFQLMYKAGCKKLMFGIESGSTPVLEKMQKRYQIPTAERVLKDAHDSGIQVMIYILIGFPNETYENFVDTKNFILKNKNSIDEVVPGVGCQVEKDSELFKNSNDYGITWDETKEKSAENWYNQFSSYDIRVKRVNELVEFCQQEDIKVITTSLEATVPQLLEV